MARPARPTAPAARRTLRRAALVSLLLALVGGAALPGAAPAGAAGGDQRARAVNPVTPGNFTGYGFDQCLAPTQRSMDKWLAHSPFLAVGIYISGDSRGCRNQPNLTPTWVATQLRKGWRLLPITLGPQASCSPHFPRYDDDETISPRRGAQGRYPRARRQGRAEAVTAVAEAQRLGIVPRSTLWYDLEGFDHTQRHCRESALAFLSAWTDKLHALDYVSGVYSSAGSGIKMLDDARVERPDAFTLPDMIWLARWDGVANTSSDYIREDGWRPGGRVKQYRGGHHETWGGVTINIDSNYLDVGKGSVAGAEEHCGGVPVNFRDYPRLAPGTTDEHRVRALQCLLTEKGVYAGKLHGRYSRATVAAARTWQEKRGLPASDSWSRRAWMTLVATGPRAIVKVGSAGPAVRKVQRALNAARPDTRVPVTGVFDKRTDQALRAYQSRVGRKVSGVANPATWTSLRTGRR